MTDDLPHRVRSLGSGQRRLLARRLLRDGHVPASRPVLVAYAESDSPDLTPAAVMAHLRERLPEHMVPARVVILDALPRSSSGKVDRAALRDAPVRRVATDAATGVAASTSLAGTGPRTPAEKTLAAIWADVLGVDEVGVDESFFELGGDSILSIRIIARANEAGLRISASQFFDAPTVAEMARVADASRAPEPAVADAAEGPAPLLPIQRWFFDHVDVDRPHWNQSALLAISAEIGYEGMDGALRSLAAHHPALRLRFHPREDGWIQEISDADDPIPLDRIDLTALSTDAERTAKIATAEARLHASLDLSRGPLARAAWFDGHPQGPRLVVVLHHLIVDGLSWQILLRDLDRAIGAPGGPPPSWPATTSITSWARHLVALADDPSIRGEVATWVADHEAYHHRLPVDRRPGPEANLRGSAITLTGTLHRDETTALLREVPKAYRTGMNDVLLTALLRAASPWTGRRSLLVDLEGHGRETEGTTFDLSGSVGWFTTVYPVPVCLAPGDDPGADLRTVKEQLRSIPRNGLGHGVLRYLSPDRATREALAARPRPEVCVNYLGQREDGGGSGLVRQIRGSTSSARSPRARRPYLLEVDAVVEAGVFSVEVTYSPDVHAAETVAGLRDRFLAELRSLIAHCLSGASGATPSDFPLAGLDQAELDVVAGLLDDDEDEDT